MGFFGDSMINLHLDWCSGFAVQLGRPSHYKIEKTPGSSSEVGSGFEEPPARVTQKTKVKLAQDVEELVLTPGKRDGEDVYEVSGEWELLPEKKCVILMVARDEIERNYTSLTLPISIVLRSSDPESILTSRVVATKRA